jgi:hypothetical protein
MAPLSKHLTDKSGPLAINRPGRDAVSPAEMRAFLSELPELDSRQIMGPGADGSLTRGMIVATTWTVILLAVLTIGPYAWKQAMAGHEKAPAAAETAAAPAENATAEKAPAEKAPAEKAPAERTVAEKAPAAKSPEPGQPPVSSKTLERLGVDEVKSADPNSNPLDSKLDDLLDKTK